MAALPSMGTVRARSDLGTLGNGPSPRARASRKVCAPTSHQLAILLKTWLRATLKACVSAEMASGLKSSGSRLGFLGSASRIASMTRLFSSHGLIDMWIELGAASGAYDSHGVPPSGLMGWFLSLILGRARLGSQIAKKETPDADILFRMEATGRTEQPIAAKKRRGTGRPFTRNDPRINRGGVPSEIRAFSSGFNKGGFNASLSRGQNSDLCFCLECGRTFRRRRTTKWSLEITPARFLCLRSRTSMTLVGVPSMANLAVCSTRLQ